MNILKNKFTQIFLTLLLVELASFNAFALPKLMPYAFFTIVIATLVLSIKDLKYGLYIVFTELIIGSLGYLFWLDIDGFRISIRIALWAVIMVVWFLKFIAKYLKANNRKLQINKKQWKLMPYFGVLFATIIWGVINGFLNGNEIKNIFFDFNGWLYFLLIFPILEVKSLWLEANHKSLAFCIISIALLWASVKTFFLLYIFSHNMFLIMPGIYTWIRDTRVGEITNMDNGFYRIFFQSHIFILIAFFVMLFLTIKKTLIVKSKKYWSLTANYLLLIIFLTVNILSFSRSNWLGLAFGLIATFLVVFKKYGFKQFLISFFTLAISGILSVGLIFAIIKFPFPNPSTGFSANMLSNRATQFTGEAALSSRWNLFPHMKKNILNAPILGSGFGTTVTYISSDPRILEKDPTGKFTTFTFEWGWLDIWIKLGVLGIVAYIALIFKIIIIGLSAKNNDKNLELKLGFSIGLLSVAIISFFSPYLNHPLGIGYVLITAMLFSELNVVDS